MQPKPFSCHVRDIREKKKTKRSTDDHKQRGANHLGAPTQEAALQLPWHVGDAKIALYQLIEGHPGVEWSIETESP